jgi:hypothetical protein
VTTPNVLQRPEWPALEVTCQLPEGNRDALIARLDRVRTISHNFGYGVGDDMDDLLAKYDRT